MNDLRLDRRGIHGNISWNSLAKFIGFLVREWRTISLGIAILGHAAWTHIGQVKQDKNIVALQKDDADFKKAVMNCFNIDQKR